MRKFSRLGTLLILILTATAVGFWLYPEKSATDPHTPGRVATHDGDPEYRNATATATQQEEATSTANEEPPETRQPLPDQLGWKDARIISVNRVALPGTGIEEETILLQPVSLPYPVRVIRQWRAGQPQGKPIEVVADRLLVKALPGVTRESLDAALDPFGARTEKALGPQGLFRIQLPDTNRETYDSILAKLRLQQDILAYAEEDPIQRIQATFPDDPLFVNQQLWGLHNTGQAATDSDTDTGTGIPDADADLPEAWDIRTDAGSVIVAVIDTGIRYTHEDLAANVWVNAAEANGVTGVDDDANGVVDDIHGINAITDLGDPVDDNSHGTHVSGTIGAVGNNGIGITGVAWNVRIMTGKFMGESGGGSTSDAIEAIDYSVRMGARILNCSWGGGFFNQSLLEVFESASEQGVITVCASGNDRSDLDEEPQYPASYAVKNLLSVAATDRRDEMGFFSNYSQGYSHLAAPGVSILSSVNEADNAYAAFNGTSMATPHVVGSLALLVAEFPDLDASRLVNRILSSADPLESLKNRTLTGGRLNVFNALNPDTRLERPWNDDFESSKVLAKDLNLIRTQNDGATIEPGEPVPGPDYGASVWFTFTPASSGRVTIDISETTFATHVTAYTGDSLEELESVEMLDPTGNAPEFQALDDTTYHIAIAGRNGETGLIVTTIAGPPANNNLVDAIELTGNNAFASNTLVNATAEPGEPLHAGIEGTGSVWWKWTAPASASYTVSTRDSRSQNSDTLLAVYTSPLPNPGVADLVAVAANDNEPGFTTSRASFSAYKNVTYYIAVDAKGEPGTAYLRLFRPPSNDNFESATVLVRDLPLSVGGTNLNASREAGEPYHNGQTGGFSVWYRYTPAEDMILQVDTNGSQTDTIMGVYTGGSVDQLTRIASDDDSGNNVASMVAFAAQRNVTYSIAVDYVDAFLGSSFTLNLSKVVYPPNDNFADSLLLEGSSIIAGGNNRGSTRERFEPGEDPTVWYSWQAPDNGRYGVFLDTIDGWRTSLAVFQGDSLDSLTSLAQDFSSGPGRDAYLEFQAVAGTYYHIQISSLNNESGEYELKLAPVDELRPPNDDLADATVLDPAQTLFAYPTYNYGATVESGEPSHSGMNGRRSIWWKVTATSSNDRYAFSTGGSEPDLVGIAVYSANTPNAANFNQLTPVASNIADPDSFYSEVSWLTQSGKTYYIAVDASTEREHDGSGRIYASFQRVPENDSFANADVIDPAGASIATWNFGATLELGEPMPLDTDSKRSLWWSFTPQVTGIYQIDTLGSRRFGYEDTTEHLTTGTLERGVDTILGIYTGTTLYSQIKVAENDSFTNESYDTYFSTIVRNSRIVTTLEAGKTYNIVVHGDNVSYDDLPNGTVTGEIHLNVQPVTPPGNDDFENAFELTGDGFLMDTRTNIGATKQDGEPTHGIQGNASLWWKWTAPYSGTWVASTAGLLYDNDGVKDTAVAVYTGESINTLSLVAVDNDSAGVNWNSSALVSFEAVEGVTYHFAVQAAGSTRGNVAFILTPPPANDSFFNATEILGTRVSSIGHNIGATNEEGDPKLEQFADNITRNPFINLKSVWWKWTATSNGIVEVDTIGSQAYTVMGVYTGDSIGALVPIIEQSNSGDPFNGYSRSISGTSSLSFTAEKDTTYYFCVEGAGLYSTSAGPLVLNLDAPPGIPLAPASFSAERINPVSVGLTWQDRATDEAAYRIERSADGLLWFEVALLEPDTQSHNDLTVDSEVSVYLYRIRAEGPGGISEWVQTALPGLPARSAWKLEHFGTIANTGISADTADPDLDGVNNLFEWVHAMDPLVSDVNASASVLRIDPSVPDETSPWTGSFAFLPDALVSGSIHLQFSADGEIWTSVWDDSQITGAEERIRIDDTVLIRVIFPVTASPELYRIVYSE